jgi:1-deoxy-D-xylulose-5-phosphate reductoisomerase
LKQATASGPQGVTILGSTGSIGVSTLDVIARHPDRFRVIALTANNQADRLFDQCRRFQPRLAVMADGDAARALAERVAAAGLSTRVECGADALGAAVERADVDVVMAAIVGAAGLRPSLHAVQAGKRVLIANKEPLVMCGDIFVQEAQRSGAILLPIDSEHNAVFQCLPDHYRAGDAPTGVRRILLTCSGGPFRNLPAESLPGVTPEQACAHPNWNMGRKISVDSATLMNKGLELIEACQLFGVTPDQVEIVIHPQSVIHSMVEYLDGSVLAQMGNPDMRTPIAHALAWPERMSSGVDGLDLFAIGRLDFERPDYERFPCLRLAVDAARSGGTTPTILNAANEVAVAAFLERRIGFTEIPRIIAAVLDKVPSHAATDLDVILRDDAAARSMATRAIADSSNRPARGAL